MYMRIGRHGWVYKIFKILKFLFLFKLILVSNLGVAKIGFRLRSCVTYKLLQSFALCLSLRELNFVLAPFGLSLSRSCVRRPARMTKTMSLSLGHTPYVGFRRCFW